MIVRLFTAITFSFALIASTHATSDDKFKVHFTHKYIVFKNDAEYRAEAAYATNADSDADSIIEVHKDFALVLRDYRYYELAGMLGELYLFRKNGSSQLIGDACDININKWSSDYRYAYARNLTRDDVDAAKFSDDHHIISSGYSIVDTKRAKMRQLTSVEIKRIGLETDFPFSSFAKRTYSPHRASSFTLQYASGSGDKWVVESPAGQKLMLISKRIQQYTKDRYLFAWLSESEIVGEESDSTDYPDDKAHHIPTRFFIWDIKLDKITYSNTSRGDSVINWQSARKIN